MDVLSEVDDEHVATTAAAANGEWFDASRITSESHTHYGGREDGDDNRRYKHWLDDGDGEGDGDDDGYGVDVNATLTAQRSAAATRAFLLRRRARTLNRTADGRANPNKQIVDCDDADDANAGVSDGDRDDDDRYQRPIKPGSWFKTAATPTPTTTSTASKSKSKTTRDRMQNNNNNNSNNNNNDENVNLNAKDGPSKCSNSKTATTRRDRDAASKKALRTDYTAYRRNRQWQHDVDTNTRAGSGGSGVSGGSRVRRAARRATNPVTFAPRWGAVGDNGDDDDDDGDNIVNDTEYSSGGNGSNVVENDVDANQHRRRQRTYADFKNDAHTHTHARQRRNNIGAAANESPPPPPLDPWHYPQRQHRSGTGGSVGIGVVVGGGGSGVGGGALYGGGYRLNAQRRLTDNTVYNRRDDDTRAARHCLAYDDAPSLSAQQRGSGGYGFVNDGGDDDEIDAFASLTMNGRQHERDRMKGRAGCEDPRVTATRRHVKLGARVKDRGDHSHGVVVTRVASRSYAHAMGMLAGDVITHVNGCGVVDKRAFAAVLGANNPASCMFQVCCEQPCLLLFRIR
jgi:hypothetical protein